MHLINSDIEDNYMFSLYLYIYQFGFYKVKNIKNYKFIISSFVLWNSVFERSSKYILIWRVFMEYTAAFQYENRQIGKGKFISKKQ